MTNAEKFKDDWGFEPNVTHCPKCGRESCAVCPYAEKCFEECASDWWNSEYRGEPTIPLSVIEKITTEIEERATYEGIYLDRADVLDIIDKAVKECTHETN